MGTLQRVFIVEKAKNYQLSKPYCAQVLISFQLIEAVREKEKYSEGFWNARSVSIGGLGKLPSRKEVEDSLSGTNAGGLDGSRNKENTILSTEGTKSGFSRKTEEQPPVLHKLTLALLDGKDRQVSTFYIEERIFSQLNAPIPKH